LALALAAAVILAWRLQLSFHLSLFFPKSADIEQKLLLKQIESGPSYSFILIGIRGDSRAGLIEVSERLRELLLDEPEFLQVQNGLPPDEESEVPAVIENHRFLLADFDFSEPGLRAALEERMHDLAFGSGPEFVELIAKDPYLSLLDILERLAPLDFAGDPWFSDDGQAVVMAETRAAATDIGAQGQAIAKIRAALATLDPDGELQYDITGAGAFGLELQRTIRTEATWRSMMATLALLFVLSVSYCSLRKVLLAGIPLGMGFLCGLSIVALFFDQVHGITLAFGFTLLGIAIDYPLHLFSHARTQPSRAAIASIWPTMRIGAISTLLAYMAITFAGSRGLAQLGLFTTGGLVAAVAVSRWWLPQLLLRPAAETPCLEGGPERPALRLYTAIITVAAAAATIWLIPAGPFWKDDLSSLSPIPQERLAQDNRLRSALGSADMRYQLVLQDADLESLLQRNEQLEQRLREAIADGQLEGWQSVSALLPSRELQQIRRSRIPPKDELQRRLEAASAALPFREDAFDPFLAAAAKERDAPLLTLESYRGTPFASLFDSQLFRIDGRWLSLTFLVRPDPEALAASIRQWEGHTPELSDIRDSSNKLLAEFRNNAVRAVSWASVLMIALLFLTRQRPRRILWLALTVAAALIVTIALLRLVHGQLTVIHLMGLLLVFGLGLDYALFFSREESAAERANTVHALVACAASTVLAFGILGSSSIPFLQSLGMTVAVGSSVSFLLGWIGHGRSILRA
jgi:predicted exporter